MKRIRLWIAPALLVAVAMILGAYENRAAAQEAAGEASAGADAGASADQSSSSGASESSSGGASESSSTQSDTSAQSDTQADSSAADTSGSASTDASSSTSTDGATQSSASQDSATSGDNQASGATSATETDASAQTGADASANQDQTQSRSTRRQQSRQADSARGDASADVDANARGRADQDSRARGRTDVDARGRADLDARGRANVNRDGRDNDRGARNNRRQRDFSAGIQFGRANDRGLVINTLERDSFFYDSGLRRGDIIVSLGGRPIRSHDDFRRWVVYQPGRRVPVVILRGGQRETVYVTYHDDVQFQDDAYARTERSGPGYLGVTFDAGIRNAAVLANVHPGSPAEEAGLQPDDDILAINGQEIRSFREALDMIRSMRAGEELVIDFARQAEQGARPMEDRTMAVLAARPAPEQRVNTRREVRVYRGGPEYGAGPIDQRYEERRTIRRSDDDRRLLDRDRDDDDRGLLDRVFD